jgi:hypothetical protein
MAAAGAAADHGSPCSTEVQAMNILTFLRILTRYPASAPPPLWSPPDMAELPEEAVPAGCGWFDSSHELNRGLLVREHATPETLAGELPLVNWLELHLSGWRPAHGADPAWQAQGAAPR